GRPWYSTTAIAAEYPPARLTKLAGRRLQIVPKRPLGGPIGANYCSARSTTPPRAAISSKIRSGPHPASRASGASRASSRAWASSRPRWPTRASSRMRILYRTRVGLPPPGALNSIRLLRASTSARTPGAWTAKRSVSNVESFAASSLITPPPVPARSSRQHAGDQLQRQLDAVGGDVLVRHHPDGARSEGEELHSPPRHRLDESLRREPQWLGSHHDDVRLDLVDVDGPLPQGGDALRQTPGVCVVFREPVHHRVQSHEAGSGKNPDLAHATAVELAEASRPGNEGGGPHHHRADRGPQSLREGEHHPVGEGTVLRHGDAGCGRGVEDASAVHVQAQTML